MNLMTAERAKRAASLIRTGEIVECGQTLNQTMPFFGTRRFDVHLKRTFMNPEPNRRGSNEELVVAEIGQVGTQLDAFPHQNIGDEAYNCVNIPRISSRNGFTEMGVDAPDRGRRCRDHPHGLGSALGAGECALRRFLPPDRRGSGGMDPAAEPDADGIGQLAGGVLALQDHAGCEPAGASAGAGGAWGAPAGEHEARCSR
jgi:hypothetical protein